MFEIFKSQRIKTSGTEILVTVGGSGPPLLLLHGYPQTHLMWHKVAPVLAKEFTVVVPDLRGYGESGKPKTTDDHFPYSKRAMALDQLEVMAALGFKEFFLAGHDRGARVSHRLAIDHPTAVKKIAVLDIIPTLKVFDEVDQRVATSYFHWFFLIQPNDFPEKMIGHDPRGYLISRLDRWGGNLDAFPQEVVEEYVRLFSNPDCIHSTCEDYRAGASIDLAHDRANLQNKIQMPLLALWGEKGLVGSAYDPLACWRERAVDVRGFAIDCGHFIPEEKPDDTIKALREFFAS